MKSIPYSAGVYLIHLDTPLSHARHYIGWASDIRQRVARHKRGEGARMLQVCVERGITFDVVRTWSGQGRAWERKLKNRKNAKLLCPVCNVRAECYPTERCMSRSAADVCPF